MLQSGFSGSLIISYKAKLGTEILFSDSLGYFVTATLTMKRGKESEWKKTKAMQLLWIWPPLDFLWHWGQQSGVGKQLHEKYKEKGISHYLQLSWRPYK